MGKSLFVSGIGMFFLLIVGVFAIVSAQDENFAFQNNSVIPHLVLDKDVQEYIEKFIEKKGIPPSDILNISEVDFEKLPKEVSISNIDNHDISIYEVNYNKSSEEQEDKIFVVTYSVNKLETQGDLIISQDKREFLNFGFSRETNGSEFLETATGVGSNFEKGYVMMRSGSITGISTNLEIVSPGGSENIEVIIFKNGQQIGFGNTISADSSGVKKDYDVQSIGTVTFESGDVISVYVHANTQIAWKDAITLLEITSTD